LGRRGDAEFFAACRSHCVAVKQARSHGIARGRVRLRNQQFPPRATVVEYHNNSLIVGLTQKNVRSVVRKQVKELSGSQRRVLAAELEQFLCGCQNSLLLCCAARLSKCILRVAGPAAWKIVPVIRVPATGDADFVAVIKFGNPTQRENQGKC